MNLSEKDFLCAKNREKLERFIAFLFEFKVENCRKLLKFHIKFVLENILSDQM